MHWFTADLHLGHEGAIRYCNRPFSTVDEMDTTIIDNINVATVPGDTLCILGDFTLRCHESIVQAYRDRINCRQIIFCRGNHDAKHADRVFGHAHDIKRIAVGENKWTPRHERQPIILCHYAMRTWQGSARGSWQLHGHSHGNLPADYHLQQMDVGVDTNEFQPYSMTDVRAKMTKLRLIQIANDGIADAWAQIDEADR